MHARLIITADDYGLREASEPILDLARASLIDRVAVLARFVSETEAQQLLATGVSIDIHLELTRLLGRGESEGDAFLVRMGNFFWCLLTRKLSRRKVEQEWREQLDLFQQKFGRLPDGMNSHEHIHFFPPLFRYFLEVAQEYGIGYVRFGSYDTIGCLRWHAAEKVISCLHRVDRYFWKRAPLTTSEYLVSGDWIDDPVDFLRQLPAGRTEVVVHPERPQERVLVRALQQG